MAPRRSARPPLRRALLHSVSVSALVVAAAAAPARAAGPYRSLGQAVTTGADAAVRAAATAGGAIAARQAGLGAQNMAVAAARFQSLAQALAGRTWNGAPVPDGVTPGGLQQAAGVAASSASSTLWSGALPTLTQTLSGGITDVTVKQTQGTAALTWQTFNVGAKTKLIFDQSAGGAQASSWIAINSVRDPNANASTILGQISAPGKVFILNRNGILFGAGAKVDVGSLVAATTDIAEAQLTRDTAGLIKSFSLYGSVDSTGKGFTPTFTDAAEGASVTVQPGAVIQTPYPTGTQGGGYVMLLGATVQNGGAITTPQGQTVLAAGNQFVLQPGYSSSNTTATVIGSQVDAQTTAAITGTGTSALGAVTNSGLIAADQGDITMAGHLVTQAGVLLATTTVNNRGTEHLLTDANDPTAAVVLAPGSVTEIVPLELYSVTDLTTKQTVLETTLRDPQASQLGTLITALDAQRASAIANSATANTQRGGGTGPQLGDANNLTDQQAEGRIEIFTGGTVTMQGGALALAQGGQVAVGGSNIVLETGSTVDVSGLNANLSAGANSLFVQGIVPFYLRDSAANRTGGLEFQNVYIDERTLVQIASGAYAGNIYTQGGLLEVSGNLGLVGHGIGEWSTLGGRVTLQAVTGNIASPVAGTVTVASGATINLTGGTVTYDAGLVKQSYVQSADGRIFNINNAPGNLVYAGVYNGETETHKRWQVTQTFVNPLLTPAQITEAAYTIGRDAGSLTVGAGTAVLDGTVAAGVTVGSTQTGARPAAVSDAFTLAQSVAPLAGGLSVGSYNGGQLIANLFGSAVLITGGSGGGTPPVVTALPDSVAGTISIAGDQLTSDGFANVTILTAGNVTLDGAVTLAEGGTITLGGHNVEINDTIVARGGKIALTTETPGNTLTLGDGFGSITLATGSALDASGIWANALLDANAFTHAGHANGGSVSIVSTGGIDLQAGSAINVSGGGVLSAAGKLTNANGGSVAISADIAPTAQQTADPNGNVVVASTIAGYATGSGGTLSIAAPNIVLGNLVDGYPQHLFVLNPGAVLTLPDDSLFATGFGNYVLNGYLGLEVDAGQQVKVTRPIYELANSASGAATGAADGTVFVKALPDVLTQVKGGDSLSLRAGASISLQSSILPALYDGGGGPVYIAQGAHISVDPKQSISVYGYGQITDLGTLTAHSGTITLANTRYEQINTDTQRADPANYVDGLSVWVGAGALVDTSGKAAVFTDSLGRRFGQAGAGGTIMLGGLGGLSATSQQSTYAQVILRPGATLNAAGASVTVDVGQGLGGATTLFGTPQTLAGDGGTIAARSLDGVAFDGTLDAAGAGPGAAGGVLQIRIDPQNLDSVKNVPVKLFAPSVIRVTQDAVPVQTEAGLVVGGATDPATIGLGRISQAQIDAGGFDTLRLYAQDAIEFQGDVSLHLARSVTLASGIIGETNATGVASVAAPYVDLIGIDLNPAGRANGDYSPTNPTLRASNTSATLNIDADLIDVQNLVDFGGARVVGTPVEPDGTIGKPVYGAAYGFASATLTSRGDIRFDIGSTGGSTALASSGNLTLSGAQIYPASGANAAIFAGDDPNAATGVNRFSGGTLTIQGPDGALPSSPFSVDGTLTLVGETILQDGVLRAPEGVIQLGSPSNAFDPNSGTSIKAVTDSVELGAQSVTSVSLIGQTVPFGGTVDGVNYLYNGAAAPTFTPLIQVFTAGFTADSGAAIDLRGGGTLAGAGFIPGRGGSTDVNKTPLLNSNTGTVTANTTDPVYAILPGYGSQYAPVAPGDAGYGTPGIGQQITIGAGEVAGLAAGTYTLLPAYYDLLPGAYRVELTGAVVQPGAAIYFGNFTTAAAVTLGVANTSVVASVPTAALITSGAGVRQLSQYDEETYNTFEVNAAKTFGSPRPFLPQDAKTLQFVLNAPSGGLTGGALPLSIASGTILAAPAAYGTAFAQSVGYGATVAVAGSVPLEILGAGDSVIPLLSADGSTTIQAYGISTDTLAALTRPVEVGYTTTIDGVHTTAGFESGTRLVLGGTLSVDATKPNLVSINAQVPDVLVAAHADLTAADILITSLGGGTIEVASGATISTLGQGAAPFGAAEGYFFNSDFGAKSYPVLALSNSNIVFAPNANLSPGSAIVIDAGATLLGGNAGSLDFVAPSGTNVQVGEAVLAAANVNVQVANINIGGEADLSLFGTLLPGGLSLTEATLNTLAQNAAVLSLTAQQAVNMLGDVTLDSGKTDLVLNTPAIYGYGITTASGSEAGNVVITAPGFTWGGVATGFAITASGTNTTVVSATPGGRLAGSVGTDGNSATLTGAAGLTIDATTITLGYGPNTQQNNQAQLDRLAVGFDTVSLTASSDITANNKSSLSVYATQDNFGQPGSLGDLTITAPLVTAQSGAVLKLTAGGTLTANSGAAAPAATGSIATLGAEIDLTAGTVDTSTSFGLPAGKLTITAQDAIDLRAGTTLDLSGRATNIFDQTAYSNGGTLIMEAYEGSNGGITEDAGAVIDVSAAGARAGSVSATAQGGAVAFDGTLNGAGATLGGSFTVAANIFTASDTQSGFDALNSALDSGGFSALRSFELGSGDILIDQTVTAHRVHIAADAGSIDVAAAINASGATVGSISLAAQNNLTLESGALLDAHATKVIVDSYGNEIDASNRAHVILTSAGGTVTLNQGAAIDVSYPDAANPQGQVQINAPRTSDGGTVNGIAVSAPDTVSITGAKSIDLYGVTTYSPTDANGTIVQDNTSPAAPAGALGLVQIDADNRAYMTAVGANEAALDTQLAGLIAAGRNSDGTSRLNLRPGVIIASTAATGNNLTISGDLDFATFRYSDPASFGFATTDAAGSGEPGSIVFRAQNNLTVNGSVSDGFLAPPDSTSGTLLSADTTGWTITAGAFSSGQYEPTNADILLPSSAFGVIGKGRNAQQSNQLVLIGALTQNGVPGIATQFDTERPISLNYDIVINPAFLKTGVVIPFTVTVGAASAPVPAGGWVATATVTRGGTVLYRQGDLIPAGFTFQTSDVLGAGSVLPVPVQTGSSAGLDGQLVPAGTRVNVFADPDIILADSTAPLPANALIPSNTLAVFGAVIDGVAQQVDSVALRATQSIAGNNVQGYLYPLAQMLPAGSQSWNMDFVAGANIAAADDTAVQARTTLQNGAFTPPPQSPDEAAGSLLIDDQHYYAINWSQVQGFQYTSAVTAFSVIRTGTGDLSLVAGGNVDQSSLYGIYTAGTQDPLASADANTLFNQPRQTLGKNGLLLPGSKKVSPEISSLISSSYQANYPNGGGDVVVAAGGDLTGDLFVQGAGSNSQGSGATSSDNVGNWLWRQGNNDAAQPTAWWINFGSLVSPLGAQGGSAQGLVQLTGFQGIGALGGGNVNVTVGGDAGQITARDEAGSGAGGLAPSTFRGEGLVVAVGGTGRVLPGTTTPVTTGGGDINVTIGGALNPLDAAAYGTGATSNNPTGESQAVNGDLIDIRGNIDMKAGAVGRIDRVFNSGTSNLYDPRTTSPFTANDGVPNGGVVVVPGDGTVSITTERDLVLGGAGDPGRVAVQALPADPSGDVGTGIFAGFSLWHTGTAISLFSSGGDATPTSLPNEVTAPTVANNLPTDFRSEYPASLLVTAATGDIIYGQVGTNPALTQGNSNLNYSLETMPSPTGQVQFLAGGSIFANGYAVDLSGADPARVSGWFAGDTSRGLGASFTTAYTNILQNGSPGGATNVLAGPEEQLTPLALFALQADTPTVNVHANDSDPARFYAATGDIVNFQSGETLNFVNAGTVGATWYLAAKPVWIIAGNDIVSSGTRPTAYPGDTLFAVQENQTQAQIQSGGAIVYSSGNLFLNNGAGESSVISAGRDILSTYGYIGGPGLLEVDAGRNLFQAAYSLGSAQELFFGSFKSLGNNLITGSPLSLTDGAGISVLAGLGSAGAGYGNFADTYFDPANQADFRGALPSPVLKDGKYEYGQTVLFDYGTEISYSSLAGVVASSSGQAFFFKPEGATAGGAGVAVPTGLAQVLKQIQASATPLPVGKSFSGLQVLLWQYANYRGTPQDALAYFNGLPGSTQKIITRLAFFDELQASGLDHGTASSTLFNSYVRGRQAIDTLFTSPATQTTAGVPAGYTGNITMYSGTVSGVATGSGAAATFDGGISTLFGGDVQVLDPGGSVEFGIPGGPAPGNSSGIVTYGSGDITIYSLGSVLLGKSRIFTTAGGNIVIWSSEGDINAGIGAKTTISYNPPVLVYDDQGNITETPPASSSGAGIATLQPLPSVPAGDVSLIAPGGTIDAGEAGIRVSGNLLLAASRVAGTANISVKGSTAGAPTVSVASLGAVEAAGAAAGAANAAAQNQQNRNSDTRDAASVVEVDVLSIGGSYEEERKRRKRGAQ